MSDDIDWLRVDLFAANNAAKTLEATLRRCEEEVFRTLLGRRRCVRRWRARIGTRGRRGARRVP